MKVLATLIVLSFVVLRSPASVHKASHADPGTTGCAVVLVSGDSQHSRAGIPFPEPLIMKVTGSSGKPAAGAEVSVKILEAPALPSGFPVSEITARADSLGLVKIMAGKVDKPGEILLLVSCKGNAGKPVFIKLYVRKPDWVFLLIIGIFGGLSLFLFGMSLMSEGVQNSAGNRLRSILATMTKNRFVAMGSGALVTTIIQSSNATNVMLISFVNSRLMHFRQTIGIMLGAAIGTTITAQIIAFNLSDYALLIIALGLALHYVSGNHTVSELGKALLGFGMLFFGMQVMSGAMVPLRTFEPFLTFIRNLQNPVAGIIVGTLMTSLVQSSSAFIGVLIILSMQGLITLDAAIPLIIGANVGTSVTVILASLKGSREAKQVALAHTLFKIVGAAISLFLVGFLTDLVLSLSDNKNLILAANGSYIAQPRQIANAHTIYNLALCLLFVPFTNLYARFIELIFPSRDMPEEPFRLRYLNDNFLKAPIVALDAARHELIRMMKKVYYMTEGIIHPFLEQKPEMLEKISRSEEEINFLRDHIVDYLLKISQNTMAGDIAEEAFIMMNAVKEFEQIADVVSHQLSEKALSWCKSHYQFSEEGKTELKKYHEDTLAILIQALKVFESFDLKAARKMKTLYKSYREEYFEMEQQHYERLKENNESTLQSSKTHLEIITLLRVISSHATNTSRILLYKSDHKNIRKWPR